MEVTTHHTAQAAGILLVASAATQIIYTALYVTETDVPRQMLWGLESVLFTLIAALAGALLGQVKRYHLAWSAIIAASLLNVVQVSVGLTMFNPFFEYAGNVEGFSPAANAVVEFSFMVYNSAKALLALALVVFSLGAGGVYGKIGASVGAVAMFSNLLSMAAGTDIFGELPVAGSSGVAATLLLGVHLLRAAEDADARQGLS